MERKKRAGKTKPQESLYQPTILAFHHKPDRTYSSLTVQLLPGKKYCKYICYSLIPSLSPCTNCKQWKAGQGLGTRLHIYVMVGRNGLPPTPDILHLGRSYQLHPNHRFLSTWGAVRLNYNPSRKKKKEPGRQSHNSAHTYLLFNIAFHHEPDRTYQV